MVTIWVDVSTVRTAVREYVEKHIIKEGQHVTKVSGSTGSFNCEIADTMEELAK
jgi:hypothetical protein